MTIADIKTRLRAKFTRRNSAAYSVTSSSAADVDVSERESADARSFKSIKSIKSKLTARSLRSRRGSQVAPPSPFSELPPMIVEKADEADADIGARAGASDRIEAGAGAGEAGEAASAPDSPKLGDANRAVGLTLESGNDQQSPSTTAATSTSKLLDVRHDHFRYDSTSTATFLPTPNSDIPSTVEDLSDGDIRPGEEAEGNATTTEDEPAIEIDPASPTPEPTGTLPSPTKPDLPRRQSLVPSQQTRLIKSLLATEIPVKENAANLDYFHNVGPSTISGNMVSRKIWVKRPGASATLVTINEDDLVDDVRDMILKKYANSLGRNFDAPDVTLRIAPREQRQERTLGPEEPMGRTLDAYFPGGQTVDEALVIDVPLRRTPRPSPRPHGPYYDETRPMEAGTDYFPPMPVPMVPSPHLPHSVPASINGHPPAVSQHAMSVITTGHVPALPSPGGSRQRQHRDRPRMGRTHTSSPSLINGHTPTTVVSNGTQAYTRKSRSRTHSSASEKSNIPPAAPPLIPTPPATDMSNAAQVARVATPPPRVSSPRPTNSRSKKKKSSAEHPNLPAGLLNGGVPPINVLIVEDNIINLKLLEAFMKRLKVRWQTAMNGKEAVTKWRTGGFHLVLMDIQLPIMSGLEATKEIRRLERLNSIGVFSSSASSSAPEREAHDEPQGEDVLPSSILFKSPVIIVALTASSLQSDRHEALAAGCNDFLTKPVNFVWLERKVMEWGCMQALIDFDGWRKWKDFSQSTDASKDASSKAKDKQQQLTAASDAEKKKRAKSKRSSLGSSNGGAAAAAVAAARSIKEENEDSPSETAIAG
ncbi:response regulator receiver domain-containing protein [Phlyctema vagabunda]|uniref:Response regulator receiver domain-containing protein n=1 Tax=Phlyctema vagabunda TaxID=108571 RepID=A0ABR4P1T4_9HELO